MRKTAWQATLVVLILLLSSSSAHSEGLSGWFDMVDTSTRDYEDGDLTSKQDVLNRNLNLDFRKSITTMLSYQLHLRTNFRDTDDTDTFGQKSTAYKRSLEPGLDLRLGTPVYDLSLGYRRQENWDKAGIFSSRSWNLIKLEDEGRETTEFYYSRFNLSPRALPSLNLNYDMQKNYDHGDNRELDDTHSTYSIGSTYLMPSSDLALGYTLYYSGSINKTPLSPTTSKTETNSFSSNYNIGYTGRLWNDRAHYTVGYQGHYARSKTEQFVLQTGAILNERTPLGGLYAQGTAPPPADNVSVDVLTSRAELIDGDVSTSTGISLSSAVSDRYQNTGILVSSQVFVDRLYIYVDQDISAESALLDVNNWSVYVSNFNQANTWTKISIKQVALDIDNVDNEYRYEIEFLSAQNASFYKVVNLDVSSVPGTVEITEIEAYGTDFPDEDILTTVTSSFTQGLNFNAGMRARPDLTFEVNYFLDRSDRNPVSVWSSLGGMIENIFSNSISGDKRDFRSNIIRNYGASATWLTHRLLTSMLRIQRSESFDNKDETDVRSNTYHLSFSSSPIPTLDASLSLIRNDSYDFGDKNTASNTALLSIGARLYRDVNSITDFVYIRSKSFEQEITTSSRQISGSIDAVLNRKLTGNLNYGFVWTLSDGTSSNSKDGSIVLTYRPGRFINVSGNVLVSDFDGDVTQGAGLQIDWLPLRVVRLNMNYQHTESDPGPSKSDSLTGYAIWYITKFADIRVTPGYSRQEEETTTEIYSLTTNINCRF